MRVKYPYLLLMMNLKGEKREDLARLLNMSKAAFNRRMNGETDFSYPEVKILADHYSVKSDDLMKEREDAAPGE